MDQDEVAFECHEIFKSRDEFFKEIGFYGLRWLPEYLSMAFDHGGYIAGGAAVRIAQQKLMGSKRYEDLFEAIESLFRQGHRPVDPTSDKNIALEEAVIGDIDVFFPSNKHYASFYVDAAAAGPTKARDVVIAPSPMGLATELTYRGKSKVQAIARYTAPIEQQLSRFDLVNSMVAFDGSKLIMAQGWRELAERKLVHVQNFKCDWVFNRILKYVSKHDYSTITRETANELFVYLKHELERAAAGEFKDKPRKSGWNAPREPGRKFTCTATDNLIVEFKRFVKQLGDEQLLIMSSYVPAGAYDVAFSELARRSSVR
jgi:uncharacterized protein (DUF2132 family)